MNMYSWCRIFSDCVCVFRFRGISRRSWTGRWGRTALPSSATEAVCPTWRPPSGRCYGSAPWPLCSSPMWPSVTPGTLNTAIHCHPPLTGWNIWFRCNVCFFRRKEFQTCKPLFFASPHFSVALGISQWGRELESSSTCGLCTMMRRNGKTLSSLTQVRGHLFIMCHILMHWSVIF